MKIINLYGGPGTGKSTMAARIFAELKEKGHDCELIGEYAKDLTWEQSHKVLQNQLFIFAQQHHRIWRCANDVEFIISDSPLLLSLFYGQDYGEAFKRLICQEHEKYVTIDIMLQREDRAYKQIGRSQTYEKAKQMDTEIFTQIQEAGYNFDLVIPSTPESLPQIINHILCTSKYTF